MLPDTSANSNYAEEMWAPAFNVNRGTLRSLALVCHVAMCARPLYLHDDINIRALFPSLHSSC